MIIAMITKSINSHPLYGRHAHDIKWIDMHVNDVLVV